MRTSFPLGGLFAAGLMAMLSTQAAEPAGEPALKLRLAESCAGCATSTLRAMQPSAAEALITISVNLEPKGEFAVLVAQDGDILVKQEEFRNFGLAGLRYRTTAVEGENYVALRSVQGIEYAFDETTLELRIQVAVRNLANRQIIDLSPKRSGQVMRTPAAGMFINYNLTASGDDRAGLDNLLAAGELGAHLGEFLLLSDGLANHDRATGHTRGTRLSTSLVRDRPDTLERLVLGDFVTTPGALGSSLRLGGLSWSRRYALDPYFVRFPGQIVSGSAALPSEVYLYSNGVLIRRDRIAPGSFQLQNLVSLSGLQVTEVVVRDVLGGEQRIANPFYFSDALLRRGLDEYSVDAGFERRQFATASNDYGNAGGALFYRRGLTDNLTLGARGEAIGSRLNLGPTANFRLGIFGVASAAYDYGRGPTGSGGAMALSHAFQSSRFGSSIALKSEQRDHPQAVSFAAANKLELAGMVSFPLAAGTSVSMSYSRRDPWNGSGSYSSTVSFRRSIDRQISLSLTARHATGLQAANEIQFSLSFVFDRAATHPTVTAQTQNGANSRVQTVQVSGGSPDGEGIVYRVNQEKGASNGVERETLNPFVQYNFRDFVGRAEYFQDRVAGSGAYQAGVSGALVNVGGQWGTSRPISDSFGMVKVGELPGIRVYANNIVIGRTGEQGTLFVPRLASYFENPIAIEDKDLPMNFTVPQVRYIVSPAYRSGTLFDFKVRRVQAVAGRLVLTGGAPVAHGEGTVMVEGLAMELFTSRSGEFYLEGVGAGEYLGRTLHRGGECQFKLSVPQSEEAVFELGSVDCHATH